MGRLFGAGGMFDQFAEQQLAPFVDMAKRPWQWLQPIGGGSGALAPFELARRLRDGLFAGGAVARAGFTLKPTGLDAGAGRVELDLDGQKWATRTARCNRSISTGPDPPAASGSGSPSSRSGRHARDRTKEGPGPGSGCCTRRSWWRRAGPIYSP